jgi:hypothetical protein
VNTFVLEKLEEFVTDKVTYYSVRFVDKEITEFEAFVLKHAQQANIQDEWADLMLWMEERLGRRSGALKHLFRHEGKADGLPPSAQYLDIDYEQNIRLYCLRISDHVVVLFNGGIKTEQRAQDCPTVKPHFTNAQYLAATITKAMSGRNREISLSVDEFELEFDDETEFGS